MADDTDAGNPGPGVDATGVPLTDPSKNVMDLVRAQVTRLDDLRRVEAAHRREIEELRWRYDTELRKTETARINAIRDVDVAAVQRAHGVAEQAAETLRTQVATTAAAAAGALSTALDPLVKSIAELQRAQYEQAGSKAQVVESRDVRGETRLNIGAVLGGLSLVLVLVFGVFGLILGIR